HEGLHNDPARLWPVSNQTTDSGRGWCHGTSGVLLGACERADLSRLDILAPQVLATGFRLNLSLCHGDIGNLMIVDQAAQHDGGGTLAEQVAVRRAELCLRSVPTILAARVGKSVINDSLLVGLAGVGYGLIALSDLLPVTSPLTLRRHRASALANR